MFSSLSCIKGSDIIVVYLLKIKIESNCMSCLFLPNLPMVTISTGTPCHPFYLVVHVSLSSTKLFNEMEPNLAEMVFVKRKYIVVQMNLVLIGEGLVGSGTKSGNLSKS